MGGPAAFYALQDLHAAQGAPTDPTGDMTQYDTQSVGQVPDVNAQYAAAANAWQHAQAPQTAPMGAQMTPQPAPPTQPGPMTAPPVSPMGPVGPVNTPPPTGDLTANVPDLQSRMQQYIDMAHRVYGGLKQPEYNTQELHERPNMVARMLADVGTFGLQEAAWAQRDAARSQYNQRVRQHNAEMDMKAFDAARNLMTADQNAQLAQARFGQAQHEFTIKQLRDQAAQNDKKLTDYMKQVEFAYKYPGMPFPHPADIGIDPITPSPTAPTAGAPGEPAGSYEPPAPGSPLAESSTGGAPAPPATAAPAAPAAPATGGGPRPGELPYDFMQRRKAEATASAQATKERLSSSGEIQRNADLVDAHLTPELDSAIDNVLPDTSGSPGVVARARGAFNASAYNPLPGGFRNLAAKGNPDVARIQSMVTAVIPFIRAVAGGTKGIRLTQTELGLLTADNLQALASGSVPKDQAHAIIGALRSVLARARGTATGETTQPPTTTPTTSGTTTATEPTTPSSIEDILKKHGY